MKAKYGLSVAKKANSANDLAGDCRLNLWRGSEGVGSGQRVRDRLKSLAGEEYGGQSELARGIGVHRQRLFDWITGKSTPDVKAWLKISDEEEEGSRRRNE